MSFEQVQISDLPESDRVYRCTDSGRYVKTRVVRPDDAAHPADLRAKNIFLHVSGSACDSEGWALPDGDGGHCIAPEKAVTVGVAELQAIAVYGVTIPQAFTQKCEQLRLECCTATLGIDDLIALKAAIPLKI